MVRGKKGWVTWASKITIKNYQLCSIKIKEATPPGRHATALYIYSAKRAHNVLGHAPLPSPPHAARTVRYPSFRMSNCFLGCFEAVVTVS